MKGNARPTVKSLLDTVARLEAALASKSPPPSPPPGTRRPGQRRRAIGEYWNHPRGSMQFQNDFLDANAVGFLTADPKGTESFTFSPPGGKPKSVKARRVHLTDRELAAVFNAEYDGEFTKAVTVRMVSVIRGLHNEGRHGKYDTKPTLPVPVFDANGEARKVA